MASPGRAPLPESNLLAVYILEKLSALSPAQLFFYDQMTGDLVRLLQQSTREDQGPDTGPV